MTKKSKKNSKGDTFEWEETEEMRKAVERLHLYLTYTIISLFI